MIDSNGVIATVDRMHDHPSRQGERKTQQRHELKQTQADLDAQSNGRKQTKEACALHEDDL